MDLEHHLEDKIAQYAKRSVALKKVSGLDINGVELTAEDHACDLILVDRSLNHNNTDQCIDWLNRQSSEKIAVVSSNYAVQDPRITYWPVWFFKLLDDPKLTRYDIQSLRPNPVQCLSINPWVHKTINIVKMSQRSWFDRCTKSFYWHQHPSEAGSWDSITEFVSTQLSAEELAVLNGLPLPYQVDLDHSPLNYFANSGPADSSCYINYVLESSTGEVFISEKVSKPLFNGQFFLVLGPKGIMQHLADLGIDIYSDLIDHGQYDQVEDTRAKIKIILDLIDNLMLLDLDQVWMDTYERRLRNQMLMYDPEFHQRLSQNLIDRIS